jgi:flavodoxin short chain
MKNALIIYGTTTGNTESMANLISNTLEKSGFTTNLKDVSRTEVNDLAEAYDLVLFGCPAYGDDTVEFQEDFEEFYEKLDGVNLKGKQLAVFAPGDSSFEYFCGTVDVLEEKIRELGGELVTNGLKIDGDPADAEDEIVEWSESIVNLIN